MITSHDLDTLKTIFATKEELVTGFKTVIEMIGDMIEEQKKTNLRLDKTNDRLDGHIRRSDKKFAEMNKKHEEMSRKFDSWYRESSIRQDAILAELQSNRIIVSNHESRLQALEQ